MGKAAERVVAAGRISERRCLSWMVIGFLAGLGEDAVVGVDESRVDVAIVLGCQSLVLLYIHSVTADINYACARRL